jgi:hypothetical protein
MDMGECQVCFEFTIFLGPEDKRVPIGLLYGTMEHFQASINSYVEKVMQESERLGRSKLLAEITVRIRAISQSHVDWLREALEG